MRDENKIREYLRLTLADGVGPKTFKLLVETFGTPHDVSLAGPIEWKRIDGIGPKTIAAMQAVTDEIIADEITVAARYNTQIICLDDDDYPPLLKRIHNPSPVLYIKGRMEKEDAVAIAIVGSRRCTHYGIEQAERFGGLLGRAGFTVISGGARGIDIAAHRGAFYAGGRTVIVQGTGLAQPYPHENVAFFDTIIDGNSGAMISEFPMRTTPNPGNFPARNRIISGMSLGVLVVEAGLPSGALITAKEALEQNREVFALPGRVDSPQSAGTHQLLRDGATLAADLDDIIKALGQVGAELDKRDELPAPVKPQNLTPAQNSLYGLLAEKAMTLDELCRATGGQPGQVAGDLTLLALRGTISQQPGNVFTLKIPREKKLF